VPLDRPAVVAEDVADAGDGGREQEPAGVHPLAEARDREAAVELDDRTVGDVGDEEAGRVRAEVDDADASHLRR
jgi:hypothetical protein